MLNIIKTGGRPDATYGTWSQGDLKGTWSHYWVGGSNYRVAVFIDGDSEFHNEVDLTRTLRYDDKHRLYQVVSDVESFIYKNDL